MTLGDFAEQYIAERYGLSAGYAAELRRVATQFARAVGPLPISRIGREHVLRYLASLNGHRSAETVNAKLREITTLLRAAAELELCPPPRKLPRRQVERRLPTAWRLDEIERLMAVLTRQTGPERVFLPLALTVYDCGSRIGALMACQVRDLVAEAPAIMLRAEVTKTRRAQWCPLSRQTGDAIRRILGPRPSPLGPLFPWPFCRRTFFVRSRQLFQEAGLYCETSGRGLWHKLRRTSGTLVELAGGDGARHLGHSRQVFETSYFAAEMDSRSQVHLLPRPAIAASLPRR